VEKEQDLAEDTDDRAEQVLEKVCYGVDHCLQITLPEPASTETRWQMTQRGPDGRS
jgi:hypothetical protein